MTVLEVTLSYFFLSFLNLWHVWKASTKAGWYNMCVWIVLLLDCGDYMNGSSKVWRRRGIWMSARLWLWVGMIISTRIPPCSRYWHWLSLIRQCRKLLRVIVIYFLTKACYEIRVKLSLLLCGKMIAEAVDKMVS